MPNRRFLVIKSYSFFLLFFLNVPGSVAEPKNPELYKKELLEIENRLDQKLKLIEEKLQRLEDLENKTSTAKPEKLPEDSGDLKVLAKESLGKDLENDKKVEVQSRPNVTGNISYGKNGFEARTDDDKFSLAIQNRIQARFSTPFDRDPRSEGDLDKDENSFMIRRARTKFRGHAYVPWLKYYMQYDWSQPVLRDANMTLDKFKWAKFWFGRGKVLYTDERVSSSGSQQFANRSIVNDLFTVDRQQGAQIYGNLFAETAYDFTYYAGVFTGLGVGVRNNDDSNLMYTVRLQWNALGGEMPFTQSDIEYHEKPALNFAIAGATNRSRCSVFETDSDSCKDLPGFAEGENGQYRVNQLAQETRFKWQGFSLQNEIHLKLVDDSLKMTGDATKKTKLRGGLVQAGYFPHYVFEIFPKNLEFAGRYALVDPNKDQQDDQQQEYSGVMTYYFNGHLNKLNFQVSHLAIDDETEERYWMQWDLSF